MSKPRTLRTLALSSALLGLAAAAPAWADANGVKIGVITDMSGLVRRSFRQELRTRRTDGGRGIRRQSARKTCDRAVGRPPRTRPTSPRRWRAAGSIPTASTW
ncbi:hypothetical protein ACTMU2_10475 [Cupriavidus basilensis]